MSFRFKEIKEYLKRHKYYLLHLLRDIIKLIVWKIYGKRIVVITTGSGGVGDYLWIRNYIPIIHQKGYKVIVIAMAHWKEIVESFDNNNADIIRYFESCLSPKKIETLFFKIFKADVFLNFRTECIADIVKYKVSYNDKGVPNNDGFYEEKNNATFEQFMSLPYGFKHTLPIVEPSEDQKELIKNRYVILVERGNTQGSLSKEQITSIVTYLINEGYTIIFNGDYKRLKTFIGTEILSNIIDGRLFTFPQYTWLVNNSTFVVTINTSIYHFAVQLNKPCVVISVNEYNTLLLYQEKQEYVFNEKLQEMYDLKNLSCYNYEVTNIELIDSQRIVNAIKKINNRIQF